MLVELIGDGIIGGAIGYDIANNVETGPSGTGEQSIAPALGIMILGGAGLLAGTIVPLLLSSEMVECKLGGGGE